MTNASPELKNIQTILGLERETRDRRSALDRITDAVSSLASSPAFIAGQVIWFTIKSSVEAAFKANHRIHDSGIKVVSVNKGVVRAATPERVR